MALSTEAAAVNSAVDTLIVAIKAFYDAATAGDAIIWTPVDRGDSTVNASFRGNAAANSVPTFSIKATSYHVDDGDFDLQIVGQDGQLYPLCWKLTNQAEDLT